MAFDAGVAARGLNSPWDDFISSQADDASQAALIKAIIAVESAWNPEAQNPSDPSYGLMQILYGSRGPYPDMSVEQLLDPISNITLGARFIRELIGRYGSTSDALSAYNAGHPLRVVSGGFSNQAYVDAVQTYWVFYLNHASAWDAGSANFEPPVTINSFVESFSSPILLGVLVIAGLVIGRR